MYRFMSILPTIMFIISICGCGTTAKFIYPAQGSKLVHFTGGPAYQKKVAVTPFKDMRGDSNESSTYFLYLIPLMPFGYGTYERPDGARMFNTVGQFDFTPSEDLAKAAALSLRESGLFKDAFFTFGGEKDKADLLLEGEILSTTYVGTLWTYGLSIAGPIMWTIGLPVGTSVNDLTVKLVLRDTSTGNTLWENAYEKKHKITQWLYYKAGHDVRGYAYMTQDIMNDSITSMNRKLQEIGIK